MSGDVISFICMVINKHFQQKPTTAIVHSNNTKTYTHTHSSKSHMAVDSYLCDTWLWHNLFEELNLFMVKNGENITLCHLLPFLICVCQRVYLRVIRCLCVRKHEMFCWGGYGRHGSCQIDITICHITFYFLDF